VVQLALIHRAPPRDQPDDADPIGIDQFRQPDRHDLDSMASGCTGWNQSFISDPKSPPRFHTPAIPAVRILVIGRGCQTFMSQPNESGPFSGINITTILAVLTLVGGLLVTVRKLSSDRPVPPPGNANAEISEQLLGTRLWDDPFASFGIVEGNPANNLLGDLGAGVETKRCQVLAITIPGGPSSEDREHRIRSRFAAVAALARAGYAPEHSDQIGCYRTNWPSTLELKLKCICLTNVASVDPIAWTDVDAWQSNLVSTGSRRLSIAFEWYTWERQTGFHSRDSPARVLVTWLDEDALDDYPAERLALFFAHLQSQAAFKPGSSTNLTLSLVGPDGSGSLRALLIELSRTNMNPAVPTVLTRVAVSLATPRAADAVLLLPPARAPDLPASSYSRQPVIDLLVRTPTTPSGLFKSVLNFAATDDRLAEGGARGAEGAQH